MTSIRTDPPVPPDAKPVVMSSNEMAEVRTRFSTTRTLMAADRTLMAWIRTSLSLLSFGFTIYKILQGFQEAEAHVVKNNTPRNTGLFLVAMGTFAMVMGTFEYWRTLKALHQQQHFLHPRAPLIMAAIMSITGVILFFSITVKLF